jgi:hypothetical protein
MAFTLSIHFSGLCLFVPEPGTLNRMHVLLPSATGSMHHHVPVMQFDAAHLKPGGTSSPPTELAAQALVRGGQMVLGGGAGASTTVCPEIVDVAGVAGTSVLPHLLTGNGGGLLATRITLTEGRMEAVAPGLCWTWDPSQPSRRMAHQAWWEMTVSDSAIEIPWTALATGGEAPERPKLYPIGSAGNEKINVSILHLPREEHGFEPQAGMPPHNGVAEHFGMYYPLFGLNQVPRLPRNPVGGNCGPKGCDHRTPMGSSAFNCMLGAG